MAKPTTTIAFALLAALSVPNFLHAETKSLRTGPQCKVEKSVKDHLVQIYVTPPKASDKYTPGRLQVFLRKEHPDYLYVPLEAKKLNDGRLHVQIAIDPNKQAGYLITVLDHHPKEQLIAFWQKLSRIKTVEPASKKN